MRNNLGYNEAKVYSPHHKSFQNSVDRPLLGANLVKGVSRGPNLKMFFHIMDQDAKGERDLSHPYF